jgi:hypothetical protein
MLLFFQGQFTTNWRVMGVGDFAKNAAIEPIEKARTVVLTVKGLDKRVNS